METKEALQFLRSIMQQDKQKLKAFNHGHLLLSVLFLYDGRTISRSEMKSRLGIGTGSTRSLMNRLALNHVATASASGFKLMPSGEEIRQSIASVIDGPFPIDVEYLRLDNSQVLYLLKGINVSSVKPIKIRDLVVRYGGTGATTCFVSKRRLRIVGMAQESGKIPKKDEEEIMKHEPKDRAMVIVVSAASEAIAASSGAAAIFDTLQSLYH